LTVLALSKRYHEQRGKSHKTIIDWAKQMIRQLHRWLPERALVIIADESYAVVEFLANVVEGRTPLGFIQGECQMMFHGKNLCFDHLLGDLLNVFGYVVPSKGLHMLPTSGTHLVTGLFRGNEMSNCLAELFPCIDEKASVTM
jgi:hypothetical protein